MGRPGVNINYVSGQLGGVTLQGDQKAGLILSGAAVSGMPLLTPKQIFSLSDAEGLGVSAANNAFAYREIEDFYKKAGTGAELWIMFFVNTTSLADVCNKSNNIARKLLDASDGTIRRLGVNRELPEGYELSNAECVDTDILQAKINLQELVDEYAAAQKPFRAMVPHLGFDKTLTGALHNFRQDSENAISMISWSAYEDGQPSVGFSLGWWVSLPAQRNLGRVKNGDVGLLQAYFPDGTPIKDLETQWDSLYDKGLTFLVRHYTRSGWFFVDDLTCAPATDDFSSLSRGVVIDKARVVIYSMLVGELLDDIDTEDNGSLSESFILYLQSELENTLIQNMRDNISGRPTIIIPAGQNFLAEEKISLSVRLRPKGHLKDIVTNLSYDNPLNN